MNLIIYIHVVGYVVSATYYITRRPPNDRLDTVIMDVMTGIIGSLFWPFILGFKLAEFEERLP